MGWPGRSLRRPGACPSRGVEDSAPATPSNLTTSNGPCPRARSPYCSSRGSGSSSAAPGLRRASGTLASFAPAPRPLELPRLLHLALDLGKAWHVGGLVRRLPVQERLLARPEAARPLLRVVDAGRVEEQPAERPGPRVLGPLILQVRLLERGQAL